MKSVKVHNKGLIISNNSWAFAIWHSDSAFYVKYHVPGGNAETTSVLCFLQTKEWEDAETLHIAMKQEPVAKAQKKVTAELFFKGI